MAKGKKAKKKKNQDSEEESETVRVDTSQLRKEEKRTPREIARGGRGIIFSEWDDNLKRNVARKLIREELDDDEEALNEFIRESQVTGQLEHPNIVPVYRLDHAKGEKEYEKGPIFLEMKYVRGDTLENIIN